MGERLSYLNTTLTGKTISNMDMNYARNLTEIQVELSTVCNALCVGCVRTASNLVETKDTIPKGKFLQKSVLLNLLQDEAARDIYKIEFCGNIDEPLAYPELLELIEDIGKISYKYRIIIHTNGSLRDEEYHHRLGSLLKKFQGGSVLRYGIDGTDHVHEFYRYQTSFSKSYANMKAAVKSGVDVTWQFLIFPWNKHQVDDAKKMASEVGCKEIRFREDRSLASEMGEEEIKRRRQEKVPQQISAGEFDMNRFLPIKATEKISCKFKGNDETMLFLSWEGKVWPCCFHSNALYAKPAVKEAFLKLVTKGCGPDFNSLHNSSLTEVLNHSFFKKQLVESWSDSSNERSWRCAEKCKVKKDYSGELNSYEVIEF